MEFSFWQWDEYLDADILNEFRNFTAEQMCVQLNRQLVYMEYMESNHYCTVPIDELCLWRGSFINSCEPFFDIYNCGMPFGNTFYDFTIFEWILFWFRWISYSNDSYIKRRVWVEKNVRSAEQNENSTKAGCGQKKIQ